MTKPDITVNSHALADTTVVITGTLGQLTRKEAEELVVEAGGKVATTVTNSTDILIVGEKPGSKLSKRQKRSELAKAKELDISIRREKDLIKAVAIDYSMLHLVPIHPEKDHEPDWEDELVTGDELRRCALQLWSNSDPEEMALLLGYKYMDGRGHDQPLVGHLIKAIEDLGIDLDEDTADKKDMIEIWHGRLIKHLDWHGTKIWLPKRIYDKNPQEYDHACNWEQMEYDEDVDEEPMMEGDVTTVVYIGDDMEYDDDLGDESLLEYYDIPTKGIDSMMGYH